MLLVEVPMEVVWSRKGLATTQKMAGQCTLAVNSFYVAPKILGQRKPLGMGTVSNIALERTIVCLEVLT